MYAQLELTLFKEVQRKANTVYLANRRRSDRHSNKYWPAVKPLHSQARQCCNLIKHTRYVLDAAGENWKVTVDVVMLYFCFENPTIYHQSTINPRWSKHLILVKQQIQILSSTPFKPTESWNSHHTFASFWWNIMSSFKVSGVQRKNRKCMLLL